MIPWSEYIPHSPTPKELAFLSLDHFREVLYGGAAGGGKSDAILMAALQYVDNPFYDAIIFRRTFSELQLADGLIPRLAQWLYNTPAKWNNQPKRWDFPSGATITFGYLDKPWDFQRYQSAAFQGVFFDELAHWEYSDDFLFVGHSRMRRNACHEHKVDGNGRPIFVTGCPECALRLSVPLRLRAGSNPGGRGGHWIKERFQIKNVNGTWTGLHPKRPYVPATLKDNPYIDQAAYRESLSNLEPVTREQLLNGDWDVTSDGRFRRKWFRRYEQAGDYLNLRVSPDNLQTIHPSKCWMFLTLDPAASERERPGVEEYFKNLGPSYTVVGVWLVTPTNQLLLWDLYRAQVEVPDVIRLTKNTYKKYVQWCQRYRTQLVGAAVESGGMQSAVSQILASEAVPLFPIYPTHDKIIMATPIILMAARGRVWLPTNAGFLPEVETELFSWVGDHRQTDDIITAFSLAGIFLSQRGVGVEPVLTAGHNLAPVATDFSEQEPMSWQ